MAGLTDCLIASEKAGRVAPPETIGVASGRRRFPSEIRKEDIPIGDLEGYAHQERERIAWCDRVRRSSLSHPSQNFFEFGDSASAVLGERRVEHGEDDAGETERDREIAYEVAVEGRRTSPAGGIHRRSREGILQIAP